jgi:catechol O-methyltransferase
MALPFRLAPSHLGHFFRFALRAGPGLVWDRVRRRPPRVERALAWARERATAGDPDSVLAALDDFARNSAFLMNVGDRKGEILDQQVLASRPARALEVGAFCGYSAIRIGRLLRQWDGRLVSIEVSKRNAAVVRQMVDLAGLGDVVDVRVGSAADVIPTLEGPIDLVFLDHWKDLYLPDLRRIEENGLLRSGSVVVADNVGFFDSSDYLRHVREGGRYDSTYRQSTLEYHDDIPDAVEISVVR